ncbi:ATP-binding protein [Micromonospora chalcea]
MTGAKDPPSGRVLAELCQQLVGVLCLANEERVARRWLQGFVQQAQQATRTDVQDPKSLAAGAVRDGTYLTERDGPDHAPVFRAVLTDGTGRQGAGTARSKKAAEKVAALDFLQQHIPTLLTGPTTRPNQRNPVPIASEPAHQRGVRRARQLLGLDPSADALLSQAFIHGSWIFENQGEASRTNQRDNTALAFVGSIAAMYENALSRTRFAATNPSAQLLTQTISNEVYARLLRQLGLTPVLLVGAGEARKGIADSIAATAVQALFGAVAVTTGFPGTVAFRWPDEWDDAWQAIAPERPAEHDEATRLEQAAVAMRLAVTQETAVSGPGHAVTVTCTTTLASETLGITTRVYAQSTSKPRARRASAAVVTRGLEALAEHDPVAALASLPADARAAAVFVLAHQAAALTSATISTQSWMLRRLFGLHLINDTRAWLGWATGADQILDSQETMPRIRDRLAEVFRKAMTTRYSTGPADRALETTLRTLETFNTPEDIDAGYLEQVGHLCTVYRALGSGEPPAQLTDSLDLWSWTYRGRLTTGISAPDVSLSGRQNAGLEAALRAVLDTDATGRIDIHAGRVITCEIRHEGGPRPTPDIVRLVCDLWNGAGAGVALQPAENGIRAVITVVPTPNNPGPIAEAVLAATEPEPDPYLSAVADLLHDIKNQVVAARKAQSVQASDEQARLFSRMTALEHLKQAKATALSLHAATPPLSPADTDGTSVEIGAFLRDYCTRMLGWLPPNIVPGFPRPLPPQPAAISATHLTAVLDNLVRNAAEAMPEGGTITLSWEADHTGIRVAVTDDGPGLPDEIADALTSGRRRSTKAGGNGIGLLGARTRLRHFGAELTVRTGAPGTTWTIALPQVQDPASETW